MPASGICPTKCKTTIRRLAIVSAGGSRIFDGDDFDGLDAARRRQLDNVAFARLEKRARNRRNPAHALGIRGRFIDTDDGDGFLGASSRA